MKKLIRYGKDGSMLQEMLVHIVLIALIFVLFFMVSGGKVESRGVKQQVLEKQIALFIDSAESGMTISIFKENLDGIINDLRLENGRVFVAINGLRVSNGYPYFSDHEVYLEERGDRFVILIK